MRSPFCSTTNFRLVGLFLPASKPAGRISGDENIYEASDRKIKKITQAFEGVGEELLERQSSMLVSPVAGFSSFRRVMSSYMQKRSCFCQPSEIMIVSGAQQGIDLVARAFINPGDIVFIEDPSFIPAIQAFRSLGARLMAIPMEEDGMNVDVLEQLLTRYRPKLIYTMPACHNRNGKISLPDPPGIQGRKGYYDGCA